MAQCGLVDITPPGVSATDAAGAALALNDDWIVIGATGVSTVGADSGAVFLQDRSAPGITAQLLQASDALAAAQFGWSVSLSGDLLVVGAPDDRSQGSVYVFRNQSGVFIEEQKLVASDGGFAHRFGEALAVESGGGSVDDVLMVGAPSHGHQGADTGRVYVFERSGGVWAETAVIDAAFPMAGDRFGASVHGTYYSAVIGAPGYDLYGLDAGAVSGFRRATWPLADWRPWGEFSGAVLSPGDRFGSSVAGYGDRAAAGAPSISGGGAVWIGANSKGGWYVPSGALEASLIESPVQDFGSVVAYAEDVNQEQRLAVGAPSLNGVAVYEVLNGRLTLNERFTAPAGQSLFGSTLATTTEALLIASSGNGAWADTVYYCDRLGDQDCGSAEIYCPPTASSTNSFPDLAISQGSNFQPYFYLIARGLPTGSLAYFVGSQAETQVALGLGQLCVGPRFLRLGPPTLAGSTGQSAVQVQRLPAVGSAMFLAFEDWRFQAVYRDLDSSLNTSSALRYRFCPL